MLDLASYPLSRLADQLGTPFYLYDAQCLRSALGRLSDLVDGPNLACRYAMKANSSRKVLQTVKDAGLWIDDIIVGCDGRPIASVDDLQRLLTQLSVGMPVKVRVLREGRLVERAAVPAESATSASR